MLNWKPHYNVLNTYYKKYLISENEENESFDDKERDDGDNEITEEEEWENGGIETSEEE
ncbi:hypothetical protein RDI58_010652 [Solanum bulbocastanum]|uniref:Uncharacterized protein n=1 Tax=Solanum bulbocastanum TaxID=147425 RepID=A0AAN8TWQ4_SOLBU